MANPKWPTTKCGCAVTEDCSPCCDGMPTGDVVFSITKAEYLSWAAGGQWLVVATGSQYESAEGDTATSSGPTTNGTTDTAKGCDPSGSVDGIETVNYTYAGGGSSSSDYGRTVYFQIRLGIVDGAYYAGLTLSMDVYGTGTGGTGYGSVSITFGGHSVAGRSNWFPGWAGRPGYINTSAYTITVTKLSPPP